MREIYLSHLLEDNDLKTILQKYHVGIEIIEFGIGNCLDNKESTLRSYKERLNEIIQSPSLSVHGPFLDLCPASFDSLIKKVTMERFEASYSMAKEIGAKHIVFHTGFNKVVYFKKSWEENSKAFWKEFLYEKDESIKVHIENEYDDDYEHIANLIDGVNHPAFSACLDIGHANYCSKVPVDKWIDGLGRRIGHVHIHNNYGIKDNHNGVLNGNIPMLETLNKIDKVNKNASWTLEISKYDDIINSLNWLKENKFLK